MQFHPSLPSPARRGFTRPDGLWLAACIAVCAIYAFVFTPSQPGLFGQDSADYLNFHYSRPLGYPAFLKLAGVNGAVLIQPVLYACAMIWLAVETVRATDSRIFAMGLIAAMMINPELNAYHGVIVSESLYCSLSIVLAVCIIRFLQTLRWTELAATSFAVGIAAAIRPVGYALIPVLLLMVLMQRQRLRQSVMWMCVAAVLPALLIVGIERGAARLLHGEDINTLFGRHLFAKAAMIPAPPAARSADVTRQSFIDALEVDFEPIRATIAAAPDRNMRQFLTLYYEKCVQYGCVSDLKRRTQVSETVFGRIALEVALNRIARNPWGFVDLIWLHYRSQWHLYAHDHPDRAREIQAFKANHELPFAALTYEFSTDFKPKPVAIVARPALIAIGFLTGILAFAALIAACRGRVPVVLAVALLEGAAVHLSMVMAALVGLGVARYTMAQWPAIVIGVGFAAMYLIGKYARSAGLRAGRAGAA